MDDISSLAMLPPSLRNRILLLADEMSSTNSISTSTIQISGNIESDASNYNDNSLKVKGDDDNIDDSSLLLLNEEALSNGDDATLSSNNTTSADFMNNLLHPALLFSLTEEKGTLLKRLYYHFLQY